MKVDDRGDDGISIRGNELLFYVSPFDPGILHVSMHTIGGSVYGNVTADEALAWADALTRLAQASKKEAA